MSLVSITNKAEQIRDVIRYLKKFKNAIIVLHIDDLIIDSSFFSGHMHDIALIHDAGLKIIIVPGARKRINEILEKYNISCSFEHNLRITKEEAMPLIKMAAFDVSNKIISALAAENSNAVIGNWVRARGKGVIKGIDFSTCGEIEKLNISALNTILDNNFIPIFPCIGWSASGKPYNISSVHLASELAISLKADKLFFLTPSTSINKETCTIPPTISLTDKGDVPSLNLEEAKTFIKENKNEKNKYIVDLLEICSTSCQKGVSRSHILNGSIEGSIPCEIFSYLGSGTMIYKSNYGSIREITHSDIPTIVNLMKPFIEKGILLSRTESDIKDKINDYIVYEIDGTIVACAALHMYTDKQAEIAAVLVEQSCAQTGIGPMILSYLIEKAKVNNCQSVFVLTTQTADWFEKNGFTSDTISSLPEERKQKWNSKRGSKILRLSL